MIHSFIIFLCSFQICSGLHKNGSHVCGRVIRKGEEKFVLLECCPDFDEDNGLCKECPSGTYGIGCNEVCLKGKYGRRCKNNCSCSAHQECHPVEGCICKQGYFEDNCTNECPPGTYGRNCNETCLPGFYGRQCRNNCNCSDNAVCDNAKGCLCTRGYHGPSCSNACPSGTFGDKCAQKCRCRTNFRCDHVTGNCSCRTNYKLVGSLCKKVKLELDDHSESEHDNTIAVYVTMTAVLLAIVCCVAGVVRAKDFVRNAFKAKRSKRKRKQDIHVTSTVVVNPRTTTNTEDIMTFPKYTTDDLEEENKTIYCEIEEQC